VRPTVSVVIPNYNHAPYLGPRLGSIFDQTFRDFEVLLLDDASTDGSRDILSSYGDDPRVRLVFNEQNSGSPFKQWNKGVALAKGDYVWIAESDDYAEPTFLERLVPLLNDNPNVGIACCQSAIVNEENETTGSYLERLASVHPTLWQEDFVMDGREMLAQYQVAMNCIPNASGALFRKSVFLAAGGAVEDMRLAGDWMTWSRLLEICDVAFVAETLNYFRVHERTVRADWLTHQQFALEYASVIHYISDRVAVPARTARLAVEKLLARWRHVVRGITLKGTLQLCAHVRAILGWRYIWPFVVIGMKGICRNSAILRPVFAGKRAEAMKPRTQVDE